MSDTKTADPKAPETVNMDDGRLVDFAGKRKLLKSSSIDSDGTIRVRLDFRNGETRTFTCPSALVAKAAAHGLEQKLGDETAGLDNVEDMVLAIDELMPRLEVGDWNAKREANGMAGTSTLLRALVEHTGKTREQIKGYLTGKTHAEKLAMRNNPKIKPIVDRIEAEKANKSGSVDSDALLEGIAAI